MLFTQDTEQRIGKVRLEVVGPRWPADLMAAQKDCAVLRCEYRVSDSSFHMDLMHADFDVVKRGLAIPHYDVEFVMLDGKAERTRFIRK